MTIFFSIIAIFTACIIAAFNHSYKLLKEEAGAKRYIEILRETRPKFAKEYKKYLKAGLDKLDSIFGKPFSDQALTINTSFAVFYAISFFALSWLIGGSGKIGSIIILSENLSIPLRFFSVFIFILVFILIFYLIFNYKKFDIAAENILSKIVPKNFQDGFIAYFLLCHFLLQPLF